MLNAIQYLGAARCLVKLADEPSDIEFPAPTSQPDPDAIAKQFAADQAAAKASWGANQAEAEKITSARPTFQKMTLGDNVSNALNAGALATSAIPGVGAVTSLGAGTFDAGRAAMQGNWEAAATAAALTGAGFIPGGRIAATVGKAGKALVGAGKTVGKTVAQTAGKAMSKVMPETMQAGKGVVNKPMAIAPKPTAPAPTPSIKPAPAPKPAVPSSAKGPETLEFKPGKTKGPSGIKLDHPVAGTAGKGGRLGKLWNMGKSVLNNQWVQMGLVNYGLGALGGGEGGGGGGGGAGRRIDAGGFWGEAPKAFASSLGKAAAHLALEKNAAGILPRLFRIASKHAFPTLFTGWAAYGAGEDILGGISEGDPSRAAWGAMQVPLALVGSGFVGKGGWSPTITKGLPGITQNKYISGLGRVAGTTEDVLVGGAKKLLSPVYAADKAMGSPLHRARQYMMSGNPKSMHGRVGNFVGDTFSREQLPSLLGFTGAYELGNRLFRGRESGEQEQEVQSPSRPAPRYMEEPLRPFSPARDQQVQSMSPQHQFMSLPDYSQ